jgi:hypothetical protein
MRVRSICNKFLTVYVSTFGEDRAARCRRDSVARRQSLAGTRNAGQVGSKQPCLLRRHGARWQTNSQLRKRIIGVLVSTPPCSPDER